MLAIIITAFASAALTASVFCCLSAAKHNEDERQIAELKIKLEDYQNINHKLMQLCRAYSQNCEDYQSYIEKLGIRIP